MGPWGIFQTIADMLKIFTKEYITPSAPTGTLQSCPRPSVAAVLLSGQSCHFPVRLWHQCKCRHPVIMAVGAIGELGVIFAGLGSNNKYAMLGGFALWPSG